MQRGVGMCTVKSTPERERACITFLKWLTEPACNVEFVTSLGYMPVTQEAFEKYLPGAVEKLSDPMYVSLYETYLQHRRHIPSTTRLRWRIIWIWRRGLKIWRG